ERAGRLTGEPDSVALPLAVGLEVGGVAGHPVVMDVLAVGQVADLGIATDAEGALWTLFQVLYLDLLALQLWLAEAVAEQLCRDAAVLLADLDVQAVALAVHQAGLGAGQKRQGGTQQDEQAAHGAGLR